MFLSRFAQRSVLPDQITRPAVSWTPQGIVPSDEHKAMADRFHTTQIHLNNVRTADKEEKEMMPPLDPMHHFNTNAGGVPLLAAEQRPVVDRFHRLRMFQKDAKAQKQQEELRKQRAKTAARCAEYNEFNTQYDGNVNTCIICHDEFVAGDEVSRLLCRHVLHDNCLDAFQRSVAATARTARRQVAVEALCPVCRGPTNNVRKYRYVSEGQFTVSEAASDASDNEGQRPGRRNDKNKYTTQQAAASSSTPPTMPMNPTVSGPTTNHLSQSASSVGSWSVLTPQQRGDYFSWWLAEGSYHATTQLDDGRQGLLVDPGAGRTW